jgi:hypothetical protein
MHFSHAHAFQFAGDANYLVHHFLRALGVEFAQVKIVQLDKFRHPGYRNVFRKRFGAQTSLSKPIPDDEDKTPAPPLDFSNEDSMKVFREEKRNFPNILANRMLHHLDAWKNEELGIIEFLEKHINGKGNGNVEQ